MGIVLSSRSGSEDMDMCEYEKVLDCSKMGTVNGHTYEYWNQDETGDAVMKIRGDGSFKIAWNGIYNMLARNGVRPGQQVRSVSYTVDDYEVSGGVSYLCIYGWTYDSGSYENMVEFYIVDNWKNYMPPGEHGTLKGSVTVQGDTYDIFTSLRVKQPSIHPNGCSDFQQYWSVRREGDRRMSGTIDVKAHFDAWKRLDMAFGDTLYEVSFCVEGFGGDKNGTGSANVSKLSFTTG